MRVKAKEKKNKTERENERGGEDGMEGLRKLKYFKS